jgi:hypothetical protein
MDQGSLVVPFLEEGAELVKALRSRSVQVEAAYWLYDSDTGEWALHVIIPDLESRGIHRSYMELGDAMRQRRDALREGEGSLMTILDMPSVRLEDHGDRIARAVSTFLQKQGGNLASVFRRSFIEGERVDDMYIYRTDMRLK